MPYITKEQLEQLNVLKIESVALGHVTERFIAEQMATERSIQARHRDVWKSIAEEHRMDLTKYEYQINYLTGEIECKGELEDE